MKIIFDIDGTMTDFHGYIEKYALPWFYRKYGLLPLKKNELELEDILDLRNVIQTKQNCTFLEAEKEAKKVLDHYWISHRFIHFSLLDRLRPGCASTLRELKRLGAEIEIYTSRAHTTARDLVGWGTRFCTIGQLWLNGVWIRPARIHYFQNDEDKLAGILLAKPHLVFDDKVYILKELCRENIPTVCVAGPHNIELQCMDGIERIEGYQNIQLEVLLKNMLGKKFSYLLRAAKSDYIWKKLKCILPLIRWYFQPIILNRSRKIDTGEAILYAPNHRSTLDPLVVTSVVKENIHWAALLRFFQAKDSIFNNSKNPFLCKITAWLFRNLEYFPIDRQTDNPKANNFHSIRDIVGFLDISQKVGIFGEGTTRRPANSDFGIFDKSFLALAKKTGAWIQPITIYWVLGQRKRQAILNFGEAFKVTDEETAMQTFLQIQQQCLRENITYANQYLQKETIDK